MLPHSLYIVFCMKKPWRATIFVVPITEISKNKKPYIGNAMQVTGS